MRRSFCVVVALSLLVFGMADAAEFKAGAALRVITPDPLLPISGGVGTPTPVTEKKGDLFARALVMEDDGVRVAIVSVDNIGFPTALCDRARTRIKGIAPEHVLIGSTHTHSAPDAYAFPDESGKHHADLAYLDRVCDLIAEAVNEAADKLQPAVLKISHEKIAERIAWNAYAPALFDPYCSVLQAVGKDGSAICTLVNYAVHPEVLGPRRGKLSPDLCGPFYDRIEERGGGMALFMNGAQGGMVTADNRKVGEEGEVSTWEECIRIGHLLADEALRIVASAQVQQHPKIHVAAKRVSFPVDSEMLRALSEGSPILELGPDNTLSAMVNLVNVGTAQMLTIPGEALPNIGAYLKRKMPTKHPFLLGLTNDALGYILTKEDWQAFDRYAYISRTCLGERTGEIYVNAALAMIANNPKPSQE